MIKRVLKRFISLGLIVVLLMPFFPSFSLTAYAATSGDLKGLSNGDIGASYTATDSGNNASWSASGNTITGSVIATSGECGATHYETTLTLTNNKSVPANLSFDYTIAQNKGTIKVAGTAVTAGGSYSSELAAGGSIKIYLKSGSTSEATRISITNLNLLVNVEATTTFQPAENGSYTVDGDAITAETSKTKKSTEAYALVATPDSGYKFMGWYSVSESKYLSSDVSATLSFDSNQTVTAVFTEESNPVFEVGGKKFIDLNEANAYAVENSLSKITLVSDGSLPSGSYTISSGVTLLIPFDAAGTCYTTAPANTADVRTAPSVYRKLTMEDGASITVNGAVSVSAKHYAYGQNGAGAPDGKYGYIYMNDGSNITVNNGGAIYVYGFVSGDGIVTAKSGATVYENMQICDFRGGSATGSMNNNAQKIFPLNQYFIQNIEAKLVLESGADEYIYTSIYAAKTTTSTAVHFIGNSGAMFSISEGGYFTKEYLPEKDRLEIGVNGDAKINNLTLTVMGISISSGNYVLPINNCMTLNVNSGTTQITQDVALLAGVQVNIANGATVQVTNGSSMYVYDADEWTKANYASTAKFKTVLYSPTRTYTRKASDLVDARIDVNGTLQADGYVYTTAGGADIISSNGTGKVVLENGAGSETATYMYKDYTTDYDTIPITSAKLHNGSQYVGTEEEYTLTDGAAAGDEFNYDKSQSKWMKEGEEPEPTYYTVTWINDDSTVLETDENVEEGETPEYNGETPTKEGDAQYSYTFKGWDPKVSPVTADVTYKAVYEQTVNRYTVTWKNWDGSVLETGSVAYGEVPEYNGETPVKEGDAENTYTFSGWTPEITAVTGDAEYTAVFTDTINTYTVIWQDWDGTVLETDEEVSYGTDPEYNGETPAKEGDAQYSYTFDGWSPAVDTVTGDITYTAVYKQTVNQYEITWKDWDGNVLKTEQVAYGETPVYSGETPVKEEDAQYIYTFTGWTPEITAVTGDATYTAAYENTAKIYKVTFLSNGGAGSMEPQELVWGDTLNANTFTKTGYKFTGWNTAVDGTGVSYEDGQTVTGLSEDIILYAQWTFWEGWVTEENSTAYVHEGERYVWTWAEIEGNTYYFGSDSYIVKGLYKTMSQDNSHEATFIFDEKSGIFQSSQNGLYDNGDDTYWTQNGEIVEFPGLIRIVKEDGSINYYYFGEDDKAVKNNTVEGYKVEKNNDLPLPAGICYPFDENGVIVHDTDTSKNGIKEADCGGLYYFIDGVKVGLGLIQIDGDYYYARTSNGQIICGQKYWVTKTNGYVTEGSYEFTEDGKMILPDTSKNGIVAENGSLYYYENGKLVYAGLIEIDGSYYYVRSTGEVVHGQTYWITKDNGLQPAGKYEFAEDGKMMIPDRSKNGIVEENGSLYYYENGKLVYAGLIEIDGDYYYVRSTGEVVHGRRYWITKHNNLLPEKSYDFDDTGKLIME